jgi:hypothetical protein
MYDQRVGRTLWPYRDQSRLWMRQPALTAPEWVGAVGVHSCNPAHQPTVAVAVGALLEKTLLAFKNFGWSDAPVATGTLLDRPSTRDWLSTPSLRFKDSFSRTPYRFRPAMMMIA